MLIRAIVCLSVSLVGCKGFVDYTVHPDPEPYYPAHQNQPIEVEHQVDTIKSRITDPTDILVVVDDSCSMADDQASLVDNLRDLLAPIIDSWSDFHFGVVNTSCFPKSECGLLQGWVEGGPHLSPETYSIMEDLVVQGFMGNARETGSAAAHMALKRKNQDTQDFFRTGPLHILVISDEPDFTKTSRDDEVEALLWEEYNLREGQMTWNSIVGITPPEAIPNPNCQDWYGARYIELAEMFGGAVGSICADDWSPVISEIADNFVGIETTYYLTRKAVSDTIEVQVINRLGATIPIEWYQVAYEPGSNSITFIENTDFPLEQLKLATVVISYDVL